MIKVFPQAESAPTTPMAPLAQLRTVDEASWRVIMRDRHPNAGAEDVPQALAAALLGDAALARRILAVGFYPMARIVGLHWPDLRPENGR